MSTGPASRPLLLLDVDGVLNPYAAPGCPPGYAEHALFPGEEPVRVCAAHGQRLAELAARFELVWATAWGAEANDQLPADTRSWASARRAPTLLIEVDPAEGLTRRTVDACLRWAQGIAGQSPRARSGLLCLRIGQFAVLNDSPLGR